jgi:hypothetical protein
VGGTAGCGALAVSPRPAPIALLAGVVCGLVCWLAYAIPPASTSDFTPLWVGARAMVAGADPYTVVPTTGTRYPLYYPLPGVMLALPLAALPFPWARVAWAVISGAAFALAALRFGRGLGPALLSACFLNALVQGQWSPLLTAGVVLPWLSAIWIAKPSIGAALFTAYPERRALVGGAVLLAMSFLIFPGWPGRWLESLQETNHVAPILRPGGFLLLLAWLRWRRAEGRLLGTLACIPHTIGLYEALPLFLIARNRWQGYALAGLSYLAAFGQAIMMPRLPGTSWESLSEARWPFVFLCLYLPALLLLLLDQAPDEPPRPA